MKKLLLPFFLFGTLAMMFVMVKTGAVLKTPVTPMGIINLEFAYNTTNAQTIVNSWASTSSKNMVEAAKINTYWDFLFLFFYAGFLFLAAKKIAAGISGPFAKAGNIIARAALLAGILDIVENVGMLLMLQGHTSNAIAFCTTIISVIKWALAAIAVLYVLTGLLALLFFKKK